MSHLVLDYTQVADAGLQSLKGLKALRSLSLNGTQVTFRGLKEWINRLQQPAIREPREAIAEREIVEPRVVSQPLRNIIGHRNRD